MSSRIITIIGMGPGNAMGLARRFGSEGFTIAMIARSDQHLRGFQKQLSREKIESYYYLADVSSPDELKSSLSYIHESLGPTEVLIYNPAVARKADLLKLSEEELLNDLHINVVGAMTAVQATVAVMEDAGSGKIFLTGGGYALEPAPSYVSLGIGKAALRNLAFSLHAQLKPKHIHVATVTICGMIHAEDDKYKPAAIAEQYWALYQQQEDAWEKEIVY
jgi:short-subunit dehydrogenase